jgi:hypothetical protein
MKLTPIVLIATLLLGACSQGIGSGYRPIVDQQSSPAAGQRIYANDLAECQSLASQSNAVESGATSALGGAAVGAALGAITGAFTGNPGMGAGLGAALGGTGGAAAGGYSGVNKQESVVKNCMRGRGWNVLD